MFLGTSAKTKGEYKYETTPGNRRRNRIEESDLLGMIKLVHETNIVTLFTQIEINSILW